MFGRRNNGPTEVVLIDPKEERRRAQHDADIRRIWQRHADEDARLAAAEAKRAGEERQQTERVLAERERRHQQEQLAQQAWGRRLRELEAALAAAQAAVRDRAALADQARARGDVDSAVRLLAELVGARHLAELAERELAGHRRR